MSLHQGILSARIVLLVLLASIFLWLVAGRPVSRRLRIVIFGVLVGALLSYPNFGVFHPDHSGYRAGHIHYVDAFHYFMGAKYLPELGYSRLYEAAFVAGRELGAFGDVTHVRDLTSYTLRQVGSLDAQAVRGRFSKERWLTFKRDLVFFGPRIEVWRELLVDRGYNDPPPRALLLHLLVRWLPANTFTLTLLTSLDYVAVIAGFCVVWRAFGEIPAALALAFFSLSFFARFDWVGGSLLRWDWIAALLISVAAFARGFSRTAGIMLGYAVLARIFPIFFLVPLGIKWIQSRDAALARCLRSAVGGVLVVAVGLVAVGEERSFLSEFLSKLHVHGTDPFINSVGLGSVMVFGAAPWSAHPDGRVYVTEAAIVGARPAPYVLPLVSAVYLLVALPLILRARPLESVMYAVPLIFCAVSPTGYYYSFLVLLVLLPWQRGGRAHWVGLIEMALLTFLLAASYAFELASGEFLPLFYQVSIQLGVFFLFWLGFEYVRLGYVNHRVAAPPGPPPGG